MINTDEISKGKINPSNITYQIVRNRPLLIRNRNVFNEILLKVIFIKISLNVCPYKLNIIRYYITIIGTRLTVRHLLLIY